MPGLSVVTPLQGETFVSQESLVNGSDRFFGLLDQSMAAIGQIGQVAQSNFVTTTKAQDLDYLEGKRLVSLEEAVGVREVSSKSVPAGPVSA